MMVEEPATKKPKLENPFDSGDGLDGLDELDKLEPLPDSGPSTSQAVVPTTTTMLGAPSGGGAAPPNYGHPTTGSNSTGGQGQSVLQELLMQSQQPATNSPRPQGFGTVNQQQPGSFNTRSPMPGGPGQMMSPPMSAQGRMPNGSAGGAPVQGPPAGAGMQQRSMYPGPQDMQGMTPQQQQQYMMAQQRMQYPGGYPGGQGYPPMGRGQPGMAQNRMMNGMRGPQQPPGQMRMMQDPQQQMAMMRGGMMAGPPGFNPAAQYPNPNEQQQRNFMAGPYMGGRGQPPQYPPMMQQQPGPGMMMEAARVNGPPGMGQMQMPVMHPGAPQNMPMTNGMPPQQQQQQQPQAGATTPSFLQQQRPPSLSNPSSHQDPEKRKLIQQQLVLLLHAHKCQQREKQAAEQMPQNGEKPPAQPLCSLPHCNTMKEVLSHMTSCNNGRSCAYAHCASSRQIIAHWKNCQREDCPVCKPLKNIQNNPTGGGSFTPTDMNTLLGPNSVGPGSVSAFGGPHSADHLAATFGSPGPSSVTSLQQMNSVPQLGGGGPMGGAHMQPASVPTAAGQQQKPPGMTNGPMSAATIQGDFNPAMQQDPFRSPIPPNKQQLSDPSKNTGLSSAIQLAINNEFPLSSLPDPQPVANDKPWHVHVTKDLRNHLVGKLVKAIFPSPDPNALLDQRIKDLITYARKVEKEMYETANDREEYYHLLAEKIYKIQKELQEKKNTRLDSRRPEQPNQVFELDELNMPYPPNITLNTDGSMPNNNWRQNGPSEAEIREREVQDTVRQLKMEAEEVRNNEIRNAAAAQAAAQPPVSSEPTPTAPLSANPMSLASSAVPTPTNGTPMGHQPLSVMSNGKPQIQIKEEGCSSVASTSSGPQSVTSVTVKQEPMTPKKEIKREATPPPGGDENFDGDTLRNYLRPIWERLRSSEDAMPFLIPVDPHLLNIPDYFDIIKKPMDLATIEHKLNTGAYRHPWEFCDDMWLMFDNAWLYNKKNSKVYKYSTKLSEMFVAEMDPVMKQMGYCCSKKLSFTPLALFCYGANMCTIARDQPYMLFEHNATNYGVTVSEKYTYCLKCFENIPPEGLNLAEANTEPNYVTKDRFLQVKNNQIDYEPFEVCKYCHRKWHRICALYDKKVFPEGFICDTCRKDKKYPKPDNKFTAKKLPHNRLSTFLEDRVNKFMRARLPGKSDNYEVIIRTLCVQDKEVEIKPMMKQKYAPMGFQEKYPYKTKAVFCFEVIDGVEVCFFGLHVQEYGSACSKPNTRRVYIAYLDSVHFFQPRELRTDVYHEILLGYLDYAKQHGYTMAHIWACPPSEGDDYIFHCHPPEQKIPKPKRLQDWYKKMLEKGVAEKTVVEFKDIYKQARDDQLTTPMALPYFEGDFWPNVIEDIIKETNNEEAQRAQQMKDEDGDEEEDFFGASDAGKKKGSKNKKNNLKKNSKNKKKQANSTGNEVADKLFSQLEKHKEVFFTIRLVTIQQEQKVLEAPTTDPDPLLSSEMMDGRDTFLSRARDDHWEFSSLRRAKYSTLCLCYALHENDSSKETAYCNKCNNVAKFHCNTCDDFDLCEKCHQNIKHEHPMEQLKSLIAQEGESGGGNRYESIQRCIQSLVHACQCRDANCRRMSCHKMKRVVQHTKMCKKRVNASCPVCKQLIALCCYHAKHCTRDSCSVPFCMNIRQKLAEQKRLSARRADMMMRRRMEGLHAGVGGGSSSTPSNTAPSTSTAVTSSTTPPSITGSASGAAAKKGGGVQASPFGGMPTNVHAQQQQQTNSMMPNLQNQPPRPGGGMTMGMGPMNPNMGPGMANRGFPGGGGMQQPYGGSMTNMPGAGPMPPAGRGQQPATMTGMQRMPGGQPLMNPPPYRPPNNGTIGHYGPQTGQQMPGISHPMPGMPGLTGQMPGMQRQQMPDERSMMEKMHQLESRLRGMRTPEEQNEFYQEIKRTPHLFSAFLKMSRNSQGQSMFPTASAYLQRETMMGHPGWQQQQYGHRPGQPSPNMGPYPGMPGRQPQPGQTPQMMPPQGQDPSTYR